MAVIEQHRAETQLVRFAFGDASVAWDETPHLAECAECRSIVDDIRRQANALRLAAVPTGRGMPDCLDDESILAFADGTIDPADSSRGALTHLLACARCRDEVAAVARLLDDPNVGSAIERLEDPPKRSHGKARRLIGLLFAGALAAGLIFALVPRSSDFTKPAYREESVTGAAAPRPVSSTGGAMPHDAFRWTSVPRADRYRITVFARDGSVIWQAQTRDTTIAVPDAVVSAPDDTILWRVDAHVGWEDRWASSDLAILNVHRAKR